MFSISCDEIWLKFSLFLRCVTALKPKCHFCSSLKCLRQADIGIFQSFVYYNFFAKKLLEMMYRAFIIDIFYKALVIGYSNNKIIYISFTIGPKMRLTKTFWGGFCQLFL